MILYHRPRVYLGCLSRQGLQRGSLRSRDPAVGDMGIPKGQHRQRPLLVTVLSRVGSKECSKVTLSAL